MSKKPTHDELEQRIWTLGKQADGCRQKDWSANKSEQLWHSVALASPYIIIITDQNGTILDVNRNATNLSPETMIGSDINDYVDPSYHGQTKNIIKQIFKESKSGGFQFEVSGPDGNALFYHVHYAPIVQNERVVRAVFISMDITDQKKAEQKVRESEERSRLILDTVDAFIMNIDRDYKIRYLNRAAHGQKIEDAIGESVYKFVSPEHHEEYGKTLEAVFKKGKTEQIELELGFPDGNSVWIEMHFTPVRDKGKVTHVTAISTDITKRKNIEHDLAMAQKELLEKAHRAEDASEAKSRFLANMSHEIRTPMNGIIGMINFLLETELTSEQVEYAETVRSSADSLLNIINDILDFSKIEADKLDIENIDFNIRATLNDISDLLALRAEEKGLEFVCLIDPDIPSLLRGDPGRLRQIIINLANNAIKFTSEGEVTVNVKLEHEDDQKVSLFFSVIDTGIGVPKDRQETLFEAFSQADTTTTREYGGTGLGLSISKRLSEMMGGKIGVESDKDKGATFWFTAVLGKQKTADGRPKKEELFDAMVDLRGIRVLVVDDNATSRHWLGVLLNSWHCRFEAVPSAEAALERLLYAAEKGDPFQIAIVDMQMPGITGETLGKRIREISILDDTILLMLTSLGERGDAARLEKIGFSAYLTKPVKQSLLYDCLITALGKKQIPPGKSEDHIITRHSIADGKRRNIRVLLAEDNETNQKVAIKILEKLGFHADLVVNGLEVLEAMENGSYDVILMDCQMPEMDGYEASREIRHLKSKSRDIPIIAMTANAMQGDREKCLAAGMNDYIAKPVEPLEVQKKVLLWAMEKDRAHQNTDISRKRKKSEDEKPDSVATLKKPTGEDVGDKNFPEEPVPIS